jgi:hypothetical protein
MNVSISFNCFSSVESVKCVHTERKESIEGICFGSEAQKRYHKTFPFARSEK